MGFFSAVRLASVIEPGDERDPDVVAAVGGPSLPGSAIFTGLTSVTRTMAMQVPAVARARNIICGTIGSLPLHRYSKVTGQRISEPPLLYQPDPASPKDVTYAWLADSIFFYGVGYLQVLSVYQEDGRPREARWIDPARVTVETNANGTIVAAYRLDGNLLPATGVGSLIDFPGLDEGLLRRASTTISTARELEQAAYRAAQEPTPITVLKNTGVDLPADKVTDLLTKWKQARQTRSTAYLSNGIDLEPVGFDPRAQQLVEARAFTVQEIARATGIPAWYLNAETASMTYSNTEQERRTLIDFSVRNYLGPIEQRLSMFDVSPQATEVRADLDGFLRGNAIERVDVLVKLIEAGIITVDEARAMEDMAPRGNAA